MLEGIWRSGIEERQDLWGREGQEAGVDAEKRWTAEVRRGIVLLS